MDKRYRTIEGFEALIEKEFISFGHQFHERLGHATQDALNDKDFCPVFIQFLDCVYQIMHQFPTLFEFNGEFLLEIAYHAFSLRFGTFLCNCDKERQQLDVRKKTTSLWSYLNSSIEKYKNYLYQPDVPFVDESKIYPEAIILRIKLWEELYMMWSLSSVVAQNESQSAFDSPL